MMIVDLEFVHLTHPKQFYRFHYIPIWSSPVERSHFVRSSDLTFVNALLSVCSRRVDLKQQHNNKCKNFKNQME